MKLSEVLAFIMRELTIAILARQQNCTIFNFGCIEYAFKWWPPPLFSLCNVINISMEVCETHTRYLAHTQTYTHNAYIIEEREREYSYRRTQDTWLCRKSAMSRINGPYLAHCNTEQHQWMTVVWNVCIKLAHTSNHRQCIVFEMNSFPTNTLNNKIKLWSTLVCIL